ncbi:MAG TPA: hypothetical protein VGL95_10100 [Acetobacteraceae bacterium]|jgi:hypothetical protein
MPAHVRFIDLLKVPLATVAVNANALKNNLTNGPGIKSPVSPAYIYKIIKDSAKRREIPVQTYTDYRQRMDSFNPADPDTKIAVPKEDWDLYFTPGTQFDAGVFTHFQIYGGKPGYTFTLVLGYTKDVLKRIEVMAPDISSPSMIWINGKGAFPNAGPPSGYEFSEEKLAA